MTDNLTNNAYKTRVSLLQRLKESDDGSNWQEFIDIYRKYLYTVIRNMGLSHHDSEEVMQSVFTKVWSHLPKFEYLPERGRFRHWLCSIARNMAYDKMRKYSADKKRELKLNILQERSDRDHYASPELAELADNEWKNYMANRALEKAKNHFNTVTIDIFTAHVRGKSMSQIAVELNVAENTCYVYCKKVKDFIKKWMREMEDQWG